MGSGVRETYLCLPQSLLLSYLNVTYFRQRCTDSFNLVLSLCGLVQETFFLVYLMVCFLSYLGVTLFRQGNTETYILVWNT